jgi:uncharacterized protein YyaL (SSP411 family)
VIAPGETLPEGHPAAGKGQVNGPDNKPRPTAYICHGPACSLPITDPAALADALAVRS